MTAAAGMCNEHTGPVAIAALVALLLAAGLRGQGLVPAYLTSLVGLTAGFLALLFAPGQSIRYRGLAERQPIFDNLLHRWPENLDVLIRGLWPITEIVLTGLSAWLIFTMLRRVIRVRAIEEGGRPSQSDPSPQIAILALACAIAGVVVILASPLTPNRMIFAPVTISIVAAVWLFERAIVWRPGAFMLMAGSLAINGWVLGQAVDLYSDLGPEDRARLEILESTPDGEMAVVPVFSRPEPSRIFWGDDLRNSRGRAYARSRAFPHLLGIETIQDAGTRFAPAKLLVAKRGIDPVLRRCRAMGSAIPSLPGSRPIPYESMLRLWQPLQDCYAGFESQAAMVSVILRTEGSIFSYTMGTLEINVGRLDRVLSRAYRLEPRSEVGHSYEIIRLQEQTDRVYVHSTTSMEHHLISSGVFSPWRPGGYVLFSCAKNHPGQCRFIDYVEMHGGDARESDMTIRSRL
jgi:hypothetical protein